MTILLELDYLRRFLVALFTYTLQTVTVLFEYLIMQNAQKVLFPNLVYKLTFMLNAFMGSLFPKL